MSLRTPKPDEWTKLTSVSSKYQADLLAGRLRQAGMDAGITKATNDPAGWLTAYRSSAGLFDLYVPAAEHSAARQLLVELGPSEPRPVDRSSHRSIRLIGRGLLALVMVSVVALFLFDALN